MGGRCQDSGRLSPEISETTTWYWLVLTSPKRRSIASDRPDFTVPPAIHPTHLSFGHVARLEVDTPANKAVLHIS